MQYKIFGPFQLPRRKAKPQTRPEDAGGKVNERADDDGSVLDFRTKEALNPFWDSVEANAGLPLRQGCGCYMFATKGGPGYRPWYVGQSKGRFQREVFAPGKRKVYSSVMDDPDKKVGTPQLFLIARLTRKGQLSKGRLSQVEADFVERLLITHAFTKNPELSNVQRTKFAKEMVVPGVFGGTTAPSKLDEATKELMKALGIT